MNPQTRELDPVAVSAYLEQHLPGFKGPLSAEKFQRGQSNPTYLLTTPVSNFVLRRKPEGNLLKSAHAVDREYRVQAALCETSVPVPKMHLLCQDESIIGSDFYIMEHIEGQNFNEPTLDELPVNSRADVYNDFNRILAALHEVDIESVGLADFGPPGSYYERQISRWCKQYRATETSVVTDMDKLMDSVTRLCPADDGQRTLVHGDYRIDNMMFSSEVSSGEIRCLALLDWELSTIGHPYADLASVIMQWQMPAGSAGRGLDGIDRDSYGLPTDDEFIAGYCNARAIDGIDNFGFYLAFSFFRMAAIMQGVLKRAIDGNASDPEGGKKLAQYIPRFAELGLEALDSH